MTQHTPVSCEPLDWRAVAAARAHAWVGRRVVYRASLDSTNRLARSWLRAGVSDATVLPAQYSAGDGTVLPAPSRSGDGTVVLADEQTQGRGRLGRTWVAPARSGLALSACLRLPRSFPLHILAMAAALAAGDTVRTVAGPRCTLKWPNDVLVDGAKVGGILIELDEVQDGWGAIVGIGLNVNAAPPLASAICLAAVTGAPLPREPLLVGLLEALECYVLAGERAPAALAAQWRDRLDTLGRVVRVRTPHAGPAPAPVVEGVAVDVDAQGALIVDAADGTRHVVHAGEVTLAAPGSGPAGPMTEDHTVPHAIN